MAQQVMLHKRRPQLCRRHPLKLKLRQSDILLPHIQYDRRLTHLIFRRPSFQNPPPRRVIVTLRIQVQA